MLSYKKLTNRSIIERMGSMKREEKNQQTKRRIMDSALKEFTEQGYDFFQAFPMYQRIFCESVIMPPRHLEAAVREQKAEFDALNISILERILAPLRLRPGISREKVVDLFVQFQDYVNVRDQKMREQDIDFKTHEEDCRRALDVLLYGVVERKEVAQ